MIQVIFKKDLFMWKAELGGKRKRLFSLHWFTPRMARLAQGWASSKHGAGKSAQISHSSGRGPSPWPAFCCLPRLPGMPRAGSAAEQPELELCPYEMPKFCVSRTNLFFQDYPICRPVIVDNILLHTFFLDILFHLFSFLTFQSFLPFLVSVARICQLLDPSRNPNIWFCWFFFWIMFTSFISLICTLISMVSFFLMTLSLGHSFSGSLK